MTQSRPNYRNQQAPQGQGQQVQQPVRGELATIVGSDANPQRLTEKLTRAAEQFNVVAPQTAVGQLPEGCDVAIVAVVVDPETETYQVTGGRGLSKVALDKIAAAAGISWDALQSRRLDDGRHPHYCHFKAVGHIREFDGSRRTIIGEKVMDLRDGSAQVEEIMAKAKTPEAGLSQLRQTRVHILSHAESKARLRAVRTIGIRASYSAEALKRPFVVAKLAWTGKTTDPELRRAFALEQQRAMLGSNAALYGTTAAPATITHQGYAPPPVGQSQADLDDFDTIDVDPEPPRAPPPRQTAPAQAPQSAPPQAPAASPSGDLSGHFMPAKKGDPRVPIEHAEDDQINYWRNRLKKGLDEGTSNYPDKDRTLLEAMDRELKRRFEGDAPAAGDAEVPF